MTRAPGDLRGRPDASDSSTQALAVVTGATGFIGRQACLALQRRGWRVRGVVRSAERASELPEQVQPVIWDLEREMPPRGVVEGARVVLHLAGRAHVMGVMASDLDAYHRVNVQATRALLDLARTSGVERFVFVSSAKVLGEGERSPYGASADPDPQDTYARSKWEAERLVQSHAGPMEWTIVRPAFVYGPSGKGNFPRLLRLASLAAWLPVPLGSVRNRRSMIYVENLADLLALCADSRQVVGRVLPGVDGPPVSTPTLLRSLCSAMGGSARLFSLPSPVLSMLFRALGRSAEWHRLSQSFEIDTAVLREIGWQPPVSFDESLRRTVGRARAA